MSDTIPFPDFYTLHDRLVAHISATGLRDSHRTSEALRRVEELEWLVVRCRSLEATAVALKGFKSDEHDPAGRQHHAALLELRVLVEGFYQSAWRLISLLSHKDEPFAGVRKLKDKCKGITYVRNHLIEHPEGDDSRIFIQSFSYGGQDGPKLKSIREPMTHDESNEEGYDSLEVATSDTHKFIDAGLYVNACELVRELSAMLPHPGYDPVGYPPRSRA